MRARTITRQCAGSGVDGGAQLSDSWRGCASPHGHQAQIYCGRGFTETAGACQTHKAPPQKVCVLPCRCSSIKFSSVLLPCRLRPLRLSCPQIPSLNVFLRGPLFQRSIEAFCKVDEHSLLLYLPVSAEQVWAIGMHLLCSPVI